MTKDWSMPLGALIFLALAIWYGALKGEWVTGGVMLLVALLWAAAAASRSRSRARTRSRGPQSGSGTGHRPGGPPGRQ